MKNEVTTNILAKTIPLFQNLSLGFDLFILCAVMLFFDSTKILNIYTTIFSWSVLSLILKILTALSIIYMILQFKLLKWKAFIPFVSNSLTIWILFSSSYVSIIWDTRIELELKINRPKYDQIIKKIESGELQPQDENGYIRLSSSPGDFVLVNQSNSVISAFFDIGTGFHDYVGFMYRSDDSAPPTTEFMETFWFCERKELHWYYCSSI